MLSLIGFRARFFDRAWNPLAASFLVSSPAGDVGSEPVAAAGGSGSFMAAWISRGPQSFFPPNIGFGDGRDGSELGVFAQRFQTPACAAGSEVLCLADGRFQARVSWKNPFTGETGTGKALPLTGDTGSFWFFNPANLELMVKVLDGRPVNGNFWIFYGSLSNVEYTLTLTDTVTGAMKSYHNAPFQIASRADVDAFAAPPDLKELPAAAGSARAEPLPQPAPALGAAGDCVPSPTALCPQNRFRVTVDFVDPRTAAHGQGRASLLTNDTGVFWFFDPANLELMVKVLDGRAVNGHFWVFYGALSDVEYTITVTDVLDGRGADLPQRAPPSRQRGGRHGFLIPIGRIHMKRCLFVFALLTAILGAVPTLAAVPAAVGPNFQVNVGAQGSQLDVDAAQDTAGDTVFVWTDQHTVPQSVQARVFDSSGSPLGFSFIVGLESQTISHPRVAMTPLGEFTVVWGNPRTIFVRRFDRLGRPLGAVNATQQPADGNLVHSPDVAVDAAGNAYVVWAVSRVAGDLILLQRFDAGNQPLGPPEQVNQVTANLRDIPRITVNPAGSLLVSWNDHRVGGSNVDVWARRYDGPSGAWAAETRINDGEPGVQKGSAAILYPEGDGAVVFTDFSVGQIRVRRLDAAGFPNGESIQLGSLGNVGIFTPDAAAGPDGTALVVWQATDSLVHAAFFDRSWNTLRGDFKPSVPADTDTEWNPVAAAGGLGSFAVAWSSAGFIGFGIPELPPHLEDGRDGSEFGVFAQRFQAPDCAAGSEVLCLADGRFQARVSWKNPFTGETGTGKALPLTGDTGSFWFFNPANLELMVKVLNGRLVNGRYWIFYGSLSNVEYTLTVTDTARGAAVKTYHNPPFQFASRADVDAFPAVPPPASLAAGTAATTLPESSPKTESALFAAGDCTPTPTSLCPQNRFQVTVDFIDPRTGITGQGRAVSLTSDTGVFWFFDPNNLELMVKVLDGGGVNGHFWVFYGALSDVDYTIKVTDTATGAMRTYHNPLHHLASGADLTAFTAGPTAGQ